MSSYRIGDLARRTSTKVETIRWYEKQGDAFYAFPINGQPIDFIATDILRVQGGKITDNWHLEDNLTFLRQIGLTPRG